jgi:hypothetical protein
VTYGEIPRRSREDITYASVDSMYYITSREVLRI